VPDFAPETSSAETSKKAQTVQDQAKEEQIETENAIKNWINGLGLADAPEVQNLEQDLSDGAILLKLFNKVSPGLVDSAKLAMKPKNKFQRLEVISYSLSLAKKLKFPDLAITPNDIFEAVEGKATALANQIRKMTLGEKDAQKKSAVRRSSTAATDLFRQSRIKATSDEDVVEWINSNIKSVRPDFAVKSLESDKIDVLVLADLVSAFLPLRRDLIQTDLSNDENRYTNCALVLGTVWKAGLPLIIHPRDLMKPTPDVVRNFASNLLVHFNIFPKLTLS